MSFVVASTADYQEVQRVGAQLLEAARDGRAQLAPRAEADRGLPRQRPVVDLPLRTRRRARAPAEPLPY